MKYKYKITYTGTTGKRISRLATDMKDAKLGKSIREKANRNSLSYSMKPRYRNIRISKIRRSK